MMPIGLLKDIMISYFFLKEIKWMEELLLDNRIFKDRFKYWSRNIDVAKDMLFPALWLAVGYTLWLRKIYNYENYKSLIIKYL